MRRFVGRVEQAALGVKVLKGVRPDQQLVKVVNDQLVELMGGQQEGLVEVKPGQTQVKRRDEDESPAFRYSVTPPVHEEQHVRSHGMRRAPR